jgi:DNA-binding NarL/FixJ family response regulator
MEEDDFIRLENARPEEGSMVASIRVLLADDNAPLLAELCVQLGTLFKIVGAVEDGKRAVDTTLWLDPDVLVLDISMPVLNGFEAASSLRDSKSRTKIVILTTYEDEEYIEAAFSSGASAFVTKQHLETDLVTAIRQVAQGNTFVSPSLRGSGSGL